MVERYTLTSLDEVAETFGVAWPTDLGPRISPRYNIAPLQSAPIQSASGLTIARWGLLPPWRGHGGKRGPHVLHAPVDEIEQVPLLRNAFKSQRCLVIADGFFAWWRGGSRRTRPRCRSSCRRPATPPGCPARARPRVHS